MPTTDISPRGTSSDVGTAVHVVILTYTAGLADVDAALGDHASWLDANYADGTFLASGPRESRVGGVILARGVERADLDRRLAQDPLHEGGIAEYVVTTFVPSRSATGTGWGR